MTAIAQRIERLRKDLGMNQEAAAARSPISQSTWSRIESGKKPPTLAEVLGVAAALGCFISTVLGHGDIQDQLQTAARTTGGSEDGAADAIEELGFYLEAKSQLRTAGFVA